MDRNTKETLLKVAEFTKEEQLRFSHRMNSIFKMGILSFAAYGLISHLGIIGTSPVFDFIEGLFVGISLGSLVLGSLLTSTFAPKLLAAKRRFIARTKKS
ncbi:MAG: hypothetical protein J6I96_06805 [Oscillospiraceae bacterium]|nr:hypothetical protein [Oscillospiraceae bacterium]